MRKLSTLLLILLAMLLVPWNIGCDKDKAPLEDNHSQVSEIAKDGILYRITTDKTVYEPGDNVLITTYIENQSTDTVAYDSSESWTTFTISSPNGIHSSRITLDGAKTSLSDLEIDIEETLNPGESVAFEFIWDKIFIDRNGREHCAPSGYYEIKIMSSIEFEDDLFTDELVTSRCSVPIVETGICIGQWPPEPEGATYAEARNAIENHQDEIRSIPKCYSISSMQLADGSYVIDVGINIGTGEYYDWSNIPAFLDGVPVTCHTGAPPVDMTGNDNKDYAT
ncbi:hypothetical protein ACFLW2_03465 [Chloroflexota bacterium]